MSANDGWTRTTKPRGLQPSQGPAPAQCTNPRHRHCLACWCPMNVFPSDRARKFCVACMTREAALPEIHELPRTASGQSW